MRFDSYTVAFFVLRDDAPALDEAELAELQDAHLAQLASLQEAGQLLVAGPLDDPRLRGLCLLRVAPEDARRLLEENPSVTAGRLAVEVYSWLVPGGAVAFPGARQPRSLAEVED